MRPKIIVVGFPDLHRMALEVARKVEIFKDITVETEIYDDFMKNFNNPGFSANNIPALISGSVLVATDRVATLLRELHRIPVIPVEFSGYALLEALKKAQAYLDNEEDEVVLMSYYKNMIEVQEYKELLKVKIRQISFNDHEEANKILTALKRKGAKVIIGGSSTSDIAKKHGIEGIPMYTYSAVEKALVHAAEILQAIRTETGKTQRFETVLGLVHSGIIYIDSNWQITTFNRAAEKILKISADKAINHPITEIIPSLHLPQNPHHLAAEANKLLRHTGQVNIVLDIVPIVDNNDKCTGAVLAVQDALVIQKSEGEIRQQLHQKTLRAGYSFANIVGQSPAILLAISKARSFSQTDFTILITGETGTGKELFAHAIHNASSRSKKPFVPINCSSLPESLLDSELFGYEQGTFTGGRKEGKPGLFELAHTGTVFLDEVGELTPSAQAHLLRVLETKEIMRVGGRQIVPVNVRIVAATNRNLLNEVKSGRFRQDLYYRLSALEVHVPPLRERKEDIPYLARVILQKCNSIFDDFLIERLQSLSLNYHWPGNIRELENILRRFSILCNNKSNSTDREEVLRSVFLSSIDEADSFKNNSSSSTFCDLPSVRFNNRIRTIEYNEINRILEEVGGNKTVAAHILGMSRSTLWRKLNRKNIVL